MGGAVLLYAAEQLSLVGLALAVGFHFLLGLTYSVVAPFRLPAKVAEPDALTGNPFTTPPTVEPSPLTSPERPASANPFRPADDSNSGG
jgi:hypothetical protein